MRPPEMVLSTESVSMDSGGTVSGFRKAAQNPHSIRERLYRRHDPVRCTCGIDGVGFEGVERRDPLIRAENAPRRGCAVDGGMDGTDGIHGLHRRVDMEAEGNSHAHAGTAGIEPRGPLFAEEQVDVALAPDVDVADKERRRDPAGMHAADCP